MEWSPQQRQALDTVGQWLKQADQPYFYLAGYAGTGKTTLAKHLAEGIDKVQYAAFTGKAALQLRKTGLENVSTIHSLIYRVVPPSLKKIAELEEKIKKVGSSDSELRQLQKELKTAQEPHFELNDESPLYNADLLVLDECSMVDQDIANDLLSFKVPILVLGDPGQLPPVRGEGFFTSNKPDCFLEEIHRQAKDNPIIATSMMIRRTGVMPKLNAEEIQFLHDKQEIREGMLAADKVIVGMNATRQGVNRAFRAHYGFESPYPNAEELLICLRNYASVGLFNGMFAHAESDGSDLENFKISTTIRTETGLLIEDLPIFSGHFDEYNTPKAIDKIPYFIRKNSYEFDFGYCITVHKSQGSQFDNVFIWDDGMFHWDKAMRKRWLYTAVTRAAENLFYARKR